MKRKAIQLANQTIVVSLPAKWVKQQGIKKGDEIDVVEEENRLIIGTTKELLSKTEINISNLSESIIWRYLKSIYRSGCDEVKVNFNNLDIIKLLSEIIGNLIGFEIIEQNSKGCLIKDISGTKGKEFENILKRIFFILISTSEEFLDFMKKNELQKVGLIIDSDLQLNKFTDYSLRLLNKSYIEINKRTVFYHTIVQLEYIGDILKLIAKKIVSPKQKKLNKETINLFEKFYTTLNCFYEFFYKFDLDKSTEIHEKRLQAEKIYDKIRISNINEKEKEIGNYMMLNVYLIENLVDDVFSLSI